jgi:hypothetical protein
MHPLISAKITKFIALVFWEFFPKNGCTKGAPEVSCEYPTERRKGQASRCRVCCAAKNGTGGREPPAVFVGK